MPLNARLRHFLSNSQTSPQSPNKQSDPALATCYYSCNAANYNITSNSNHRLKSVVDMHANLCVEERRLLCLYVKMTMRPDSCIKRGKFALRNKMATKPRFVPHAFAQAAQRKHKIRLAVSYCPPRQNNIKNNE